MRRPGRDAVLDGPAGTIEHEQALGRRVGCWQAGDQIDRFGADIAVDLARAHEPNDLREAGPIEMRHGFGRHLGTARLDAAVAFFERSRSPKIRRRTVVAQGDDCQRLRRSPLSKPAGCL